MQHQNSNVAKGDIVWARVQFPHQFWPALVLCTDSLGVCVSFFNHNLSRCPRYVIESEVLPFEQSFRWIMGRPRKDVKKCETFYALLHSALKLMGQRVVSSLKCRCQTIPSHRDSGGGGGNSGRERFDGSDSNSCFQPNRALGFVLRVAVLPWVDEVDFVDAVRAVAQVQAFRGYCSIEQKRVYQKTQETGKDVKLLQGSSLGEKMHSVTQESVALKPKHESQIPFKQVEKNLAIGAVKRLNSGIPILKGNVSSLYENQFYIIPQTQIKNSKAEFLQEISPHLHSLTFDPFHLMGESLQYVNHGLSRFQNISEQNIFDIFFETCCKMSKPHFSIPCDMMTQLSCNFKRSKGTKTFIQLTKKRRRLDHPALCDCSFKLQKLSSFSSANEASVNKEDDSDVSILPSSSADCFSSCNKMENTDSYLASLLQSPIKLEIHQPCPNRGFSVIYMGGTSSSCKSLFKDSSFHVGFPPKDSVQETEGNALVSKHIRPCISQIKMLELDKSIQKHHQGDICSKETLGKVTDEVKQSFALESLSNSVLGAYSNNYEVDANPITIKALKGSDSTKDLRLSDTRVVSKTGGSTFESQSKPKLTNKGSDSTLDQKRTQINCSSGDKTPLKSKKSARINISSGGCLEKNENLNKSDNSYTMVNSKVGEQSKKQVSHACSKSLHMKFPKDFKLPSKWELIKKFKVFGPVDNLKTRVFSFTASAQVAFLQETDAVTAYLYAKTKKDSFGRANVRFWLDSFEYKRESSKYSTQMSPSSKPVPLKSCLKNSSSQKKGNRKKPYKVRFTIVT